MGGHITPFAYGPVALLHQYLAALTDEDASEGMLTPLFRLSRNIKRLAHIVLVIERLSGRCHLGPHNMEQASTGVETFGTRTEHAKVALSPDRRNAADFLQLRNDTAFSSVTVAGVPYGWAPATDLIHAA
jgi:hypothetical protein